jgi:CelD/BcsL family acetyltransferase involved in cellulose biosynthesis
MAHQRLTWQNLPAGQLQADPALREHWDRLNAQRGNLPILSSYAVLAALSAFARGDERLLIGRSAQMVAAMLVLQRVGPGRWQTFQPSQLPLGAWVAESGEDLRTVAQQLLRGPLGASLVLSITQIDPLFAPREEDGPSWTSSEYVETGWIDIEGTFDEYWSQRGKNLRANMSKQRKKLAAEGVAVDLMEMHSAEDMSPALARYAAMESAGWKATEGTAIHPDSDQGRFYRALLEEAARRGEAVVYECRFDGRAVASNLCIRRDGTLIVLKTTYDETVEKSLSPAFLLRQHELQQFFASKEYQRLEFYGRFREWHSRWTDCKRVLHHLTLYRWPWLKRIKQLSAISWSRGESMTSSHEP